MHTLPRNLQYQVWNKSSLEEIFTHCNEHLIAFPEKLTLCDDQGFWKFRLLSLGGNVIQYNNLSNSITPFDKYIITLCLQELVHKDSEVLFHITKLYPQYTYLYGEVGLINKAIDAKDVSLLTYCLDKNMEWDISMNKLYPIAHLLPLDIKEKLGVTDIYLATGLNMNEEEYIFYLKGLHNKNLPSEYNDQIFYLIGLSRRTDNNEKKFAKLCKKILNTESDVILDSVLINDGNFKLLNYTYSKFTYTFTGEIISGNFYRYLSALLSSEIPESYNSLQEWIISYSTDYPFEDESILSFEMYITMFQYFDMYLDRFQDMIIQGLIKNTDYRLLPYLKRWDEDLPPYIKYHLTN